MVWVLFSMAAVFASLGLLCYMAVEFSWKSVGAYFSTAWLKPTLSILKWLSGTVAVLAKSIETSDQQLATWTAYIVLAGLLLWELVDNRSSIKRDADKKSAEEASKERDAAYELVRDQGYLRTKLLVSLGELVAHKKQRALGTLGRISEGAFSRDIRGAHLAGLSPHDQRLLILQTLTSFLHELLPRCEESERQNFRVGFYVEKEGRMEPVESWDHRRKARQFLTSYERVPDKFRLSCENKAAYAVQCVKQRKLLIVPDCLDDGTYYFPEQAGYLKSLIAFPIIDFVRAKQPIAASIVVDTNVEGFFSEEDRPTIESYMEQFALQLDLEAVAEMLLTTSGVSSSGKKGHRKQKPG
ncbi:MAG: hypothetical protein BGO49_30810 [Planctomycetales bacterium 71-10]|nr:MAG: hypothetical protein BGO49_30810 [Planctomycetales bacterium 71-10]